MKMLLFIGKWLISTGAAVWISYIFCKDNSKYVGVDFDLINSVDFVSIILFSVVVISAYYQKIQFILLTITGVAFFIANWGPNFPDVFELVSIFFPLTPVSIFAYSIYLLGGILVIFAERQTSRKSFVSCLSCFLPPLDSLGRILLYLGAMGFGSYLFKTLLWSIGFLFLTYVMDVPGMDLSFYEDDFVGWGRFALTVLLSGAALMFVGVLIRSASQTE